MRAGMKQGDRMRPEIKQGDMMRPEMKHITGLKYQQQDKWISGRCLI
jgi:hypothetical protein